MSTHPLIGSEPNSPYGTVCATPVSENEPDRESVSIRRYVAPQRWYLAYYIPSLTWIRKYSLKALPGDICAGLTLASFQIPVSLSYATSLAGVSAISGLWGIIMPPIVYSILGSVPLMVVAPEGPISLVMGKAVAPYFDVPEHRHGRHAFSPEMVSAIIAGSAGAIVLAMGLARVGFLGNVLSQSMLRGFVTGVGMVIIADQLPSQLGLNDEMRAALGHDASSFDKLVFLWDNWKNAHMITTWFAMISLIAILILKWLKTYLSVNKGYKRAIIVPEILIVVALSTIISSWGHYDMQGLAVVGDVRPDKLELNWMLQPKYWSDFRINFQSSLFIGVLGVLESTVAARMLGTGDTASSANRELVALGTANVLGSIFGALPSFGGYGRSRMNSLTGGTTQVSGIVASVTTLVFTYKFMGYLYYLPKCILSSVISSIGLTLILEAPAEIRFFWKVSAYSDILTAFVSLLVTFFVSVEAGVASGAAVALIRVLYSATRPRIQILTRKPGSHTFVNADDMPDMPPGLNDVNSGLLVIKIPEPLNFANSVVLEERLRRLELYRTNKAHPGRPPQQDKPLEVVIFHLKGMTELDATAATVIESIVQSYLKRNIRVIFTHIVHDKDVQNLLEKSGIMDLLNSQQKPAYFESVSAAIADTAISWA